MAANLSEFYSHRRMEDITNKHKKHKLDNEKDGNNKRTCYPPVQERLPSPSSPCSSESPKHSRNKSVLFVLDKNQLYEASPLLTPKDEDDDDVGPDDVGYNKDTNYDLACAAGVDLDDALSNLPLLAPEKQLDDNPDYIALTSTLSQLTRTKDAISSEISSLSRVRKSAQTAAKLDLVGFYMELICGKKLLPQQHRVMRAPTVQWTRYHLEMASVSLEDTTNDCNDRRLFKTVLMFQASPWDMRPAVKCFGKLMAKWPCILVEVWNATALCPLVALYKVNIMKKCK